MAEQLTHRGLDVTIVQRSNHVMAHMDKDIVSRVEDHIVKKGVNLIFK
jgi:pyruvate/2-oxoglutarate dehydrogenase complex dihydrolipoamide dehydrogenase (E3) component